MSKELYGETLFRTVPPLRIYPSFAHDTGTHPTVAGVWACNWAHPADRSTRQHMANFDNGGSPSLSQASVKGTVKWFNATKGYGFITLETGSDAFCHASALQAAGHADLPQGATIVCDLQIHLADCRSWLCTMWIRAPLTQAPHAVLAESLATEAAVAAAGSAAATVSVEAGTVLAVVTGLARTALQAVTVSAARVTPVPAVQWSRERSSSSTTRRASVSLCRTAAAVTSTSMPAPCAAPVSRYWSRSNVFASPPARAKKALKSTE